MISHEVCEYTKLVHIAHQNSIFFYAYLCNMYTHTSSTGLPMENVILCLSLFGLGRRMLIPLFRFELEKCLMNTFSTLSISLVTCREKSFTKLSNKHFTCIQNDDAKA